jgi:hypothetical protein
MTPDTIANCPFNELPAMFPDATPDELRRIRKRAKNALWQRDYRKTETRRTYFHGDGPPIARCEEHERYLRNARAGSAKLLAEIERVFGRAG